MSHAVSKVIFDPSHLKTPKTKVAPPSVQQNGDGSYNPPIMMDEFGQTPDHYYLARKPSSFIQVKRKLNLQSAPPSSEDGNRKSSRRRRKLDLIPKAKKASKTRYDTSLGQLTKKFLKLLSDAADGVINLNTACTLLSVPKRRLYDITNVLEGAGLIQKTSRNNIQWKGRVSTSTSSGVMYDIEKEIDILEAKENNLDELIYHMKSEIKALKESEGEYLYVTNDELKNIEEFSTNTVVGVKLASGEQIIEPSENKVLVTSKTTELESFLVLEDASLIDILHPRAEFKENSYNVQICNSHLVGLIKEEEEESEEETDVIDYVEYPNDDVATFAELCAARVWNEGLGSGASYSRPRAEWNQGDTMKSAFITDEDDIAPLSRNFLLQTEDQDLELPFPNLELEDSYSFSLDDGEGLSDLYDCQFHAHRKSHF